MASYTSVNECRGPNKYLTCDNENKITYSYCTVPVVYPYDFSSLDIHSKLIIQNRRRTRGYNFFFKFIVILKQNVDVFFL